MAVSAEDLIFGDFSELGSEEYQALFSIFREPLQSSSVEFPWDEKTYVKTTGPSGGDRGISDPDHTWRQPPFQSNEPNHASLQKNDTILQQELYPDRQFAQTATHHSLANDAEGARTQPATNVAAVCGQWNSELVHNFATETQEQSSDGTMPSEAQSDETRRKRRNKKRRDPDHFKSFYNRVDAEYCADNESSGDNGLHTLTDSGQEVGSSTKHHYVAPSVPVPQRGSNDSVTISSIYNGDEKTTERTSMSMQPSAAIVTNSDVMTGDTYKTHSYTEAKVEISQYKDISEEMPPSVIAKTDIECDTGVKSSQAAELNPTHRVPTSVDVSVNVPVDVPAIPVISLDDSNLATNVTDKDTVAATVQPGVGDAQASSKPAPVTQPPSRSWASLFKSGSTAESGSPASVPPSASGIGTLPKPNEQPDDDTVAVVPTNQDPHAKELGDHLSKVTPSHHPMLLQPRGLINTANWCYINSILQALLSCPPFYHLMKSLPLNTKQRKSSSTPMLDAIVQFLNEFHELKGVPKRSAVDNRPGPPFEPANIYQMLSIVQTSLAIKQGRQEDAEEFLSCLLNGLHDEMISLIQSSLQEPGQQQAEKTNGPSLAMPNGDVDNADEDNSDNEDEWEQVGPRNKTSITRKAQFSRSPLSDIFGGVMRSALHQMGSKESATLQPFFSLQLDIQSKDIWSVQHALDTLGNKESVHGFMSNKTKKEVEAFRRISLEELPPVLILHLKRFLYDKSGGCQKLMKKVDYAIDLEINKDLISPNAKSRISFNQRNYKLFAVVYHTGKEASGGHYITDVFQVGCNGWLRCDDSIIRIVKPTQVIKPQASYTPYLLFYRRRDLLERMP